MTCPDQGGDTDMGDVDSLGLEGVVQIQHPVAQARGGDADVPRNVTLAEESPRARLHTFVESMIDLQLSDPALDDAMLRRFPNATTLIDACERSTALGARLVEEAHAAGVLSTSFTADDLMAMLWMAGTASRDEAAPSGWRRVVDRGLAAAWTHSID